MNVAKNLIDMLGEINAKKCGKSILFIPAIYR